MRHAAVGCPCEMVIESMEGVAHGWFLSQMAKAARIEKPHGETVRLSALHFQQDSCGWAWQCGLVLTSVQGEQIVAEHQRANLGLRHA